MDIEEDFELNLLEPEATADFDLSAFARPAYAVEEEGKPVAKRAAVLRKTRIASGEAALPEKSSAKESGRAVQAKTLKRAREPSLASVPPSVPVQSAREIKPIAQSEEESAAVPEESSGAVVREKRAYRARTAEEDPSEFHARPRDLSLNGASFPASEDAAPESRLIFSREPVGSLPLHPRLLSVLERPVSEGGLGLVTATRVQNVVVPLLARGANLLMKSQTGSGKSLAYLLPILQDLMTNHSLVKRDGGTLALIIAPTRELGMQITDVLASLTKCCAWVVCGSISGGEKRKSEKARLRKGVVVLVSTPGRLLDHARTTESFKLNKLKWVVLDEADRLLDMGFEQTILEVLSIIRGAKLPGLKEKPATEQGKVLTTLDQRWRAQAVAALKTCVNVQGLSHIMASATITKAVRELAMPVMGGREFFFVDADAETVDTIANAEDLVRVERERAVAAARTSARVSDGVVRFDDEPEEQAQEQAGREEGRRRSALGEGEAMHAPAQLKQYSMVVSCKWRLAALVSCLKHYSAHKVVVFFSTCDSVDFHGLLLANTDWPLDLDPEPSPHTGPDDPNPLKRTHTLDPLQTRFTGLLGPACNVYRLHGNVPQKVRQEVYREFCAASAGVLLCTDVAARGLDLPRVDWIIQYDPPCETTDYVHRIGRTARRGLGGSAILFLLPSERQYINLLNSHDLFPEPLSLQSLFLDVATHIPGAAKFKNTDEMAAVVLHRRMERTVQGNRHLLGAARQAFRSFIRAYATHSSDTKGIFKVQSLHLGHCAKSFALRDPPTALRNHENVIERIFNGECTALAMDELKQERRDGKATSKKRTAGAARANEQSMARRKLSKQLSLSENANG